MNAQIQNVKRKLVARNRLAFPESRGQAKFEHVQEGVIR